MRVTFFGHSTVLIEQDGLRLLTDPLLRPRIGHLRRYVPLPGAEMIGLIDAVLISHAHHDHLDLASLRTLRTLCPGAVMIGPGGLARHVKRVGFELTELLPEEAMQLGDLTIRATPADHDGRRLPWMPALQPVGFVLDGSTRVYFAGDTDLFPGMADIHEDLDVALVPVAGWGPRVPAGHLDPDRAARALPLLRPKVAIPIHWGTYSSPGSRLDDPHAPAREFAELAKTTAPDVEVRIVPPGRSTTFNEPA